MLKAYKCIKCGAPYGPFFMWMSDTNWKELGFDKEDFVCAHCLIDFIDEKGIWIGYLELGRGKDK